MYNCIKKKNYLEINWSKKVNNYTLETIKYWQKKVKTTKTNGKIYCPSELEALISLKCPYYLQAIYRFNAIPFKTPMVFFMELKEIIQNFVLKTDSEQKKKF